MAEQVFVVPRRELFPPEEPPPTGFVPGTADPYFERLSRGFFTPRAAAETDPRLKQIIPYGLVTWTDQVFLMRRTRRGGESRLHGLRSVGVGGHVNPVDSDDHRDQHRPQADPLAGKGRRLLEAALLREVGEELILEGPVSTEVIGILNDDSNDVGQVHFGVVYRLVTERPSVRVREVEQLEGRFVPVAQLGQLIDSMEGWSRLLVESFWPATPWLRGSPTGAG